MFPEYGYGNNNNGFGSLGGWGGGILGFILGQAVPNDDRHLCMYIKNTIDDPDGYEGQVFFRWLTDMKKTNTPVDWAEFV